MVAIRGRSKVLRYEIEDQGILSALRNQLVQLGEVLRHQMVAQAHPQGML
jgi:hypothetical protein